jgi:carboxypeptidase Taq
VTGAATDLREYLAPVEDLGAIIHLLAYDQEAVMPPGGNAARGRQTATVSALVHERMAAPELAALLDAAEGAGAEGDDAALVRWVRREADRARRVPSELVEALAIAASEGQEAWEQARRDDDFEAFAPFLERNVRLCAEYAACFEEAEPYDALLAEYEPGMTTAELRPVFAALRAELPALVAAAAERAAPPLTGRHFPVEAQRAASLAVLRRVGFDERSWVLGEAAHPFSATPGRGDNRITTRYPEDSLETLLSSLHEFGHGLYEAQTDPALDRTPLGHGVSMGVHESQSRLWELFVGMSLPFWRGAWHEVREAFGGDPGGVSLEEFVASVNRVAPTLIRVDADPVSYPLHIVLRFELELALLSGDLGVADLPAAWNDGMRDLLGIVPPDDRTGVLQDIHWGGATFGYFPTYALGTILAAQLWEVVEAELGDVDALLEAGDLEPLREWLRERIHHHGRRMDPSELIVAATGRGLDAGPYLAFARAHAAG